MGAKRPSAREAPKRPRSGQRARPGASPQSSRLPAIPSTWRSPITPCQGPCTTTPSKTRGPLTRCDSPEGGRWDGRQHQPLPKHPVAKTVPLPIPERLPVRRGLPEGRTPNEGNPKARARPRCSPHPVPGATRHASLPVPTDRVTDVDLGCGQLAESWNLLKVRRRPDLGEGAVRET